MFISPMLLQKNDEPFDDDNWLSELKLDGIRFLYSTMDGTNFYTRHNNLVTERFPELLDNQMSKGILLDGEIVITDKFGRPDFEALMSRFQVSNLKRIPIESQINPITFCAFDVVYYQGKKISHLPLTERKQLLNEILPVDTPHITKTLSLQGKGKELYELVKSQDLEGIVLKKKDSKYEIGKRSKNWLKVVNYKYLTVSIAGFRKSEFGWLLKYPDSKLAAGLMELVPVEARKFVYELAKRIKTVETNDYIYFPNDSLKCKIKYRALTKGGLLRLPSFLEFDFAAS